MYVFLEHTTLYHSNQQVSSSCSHYRGNPSVGILDELSLSPSATFSSPPWFNDELLLQKPAPIVHFSRILQCHFDDLCCTFFLSDPLSLRFHGTNWIWISVRYDGWDNFPRVMMLILWWPGNMMSCLAPPPGWRTYHYRFLFSKVIHSSMRKL